MALSLQKYFEYWILHYNILYNILISGLVSSHLILMTFQTIRNFMATNSIERGNNSQSSSRRIHDISLI